MTPSVKITASLVLASAAVLGLAACSSGGSSAAAPSSAAPSAAASSAPASAGASSAASSAPATPVNIAPEVIAAYFKSVCLAPTAKLGVDGALSADGTVCTTPEGKDVNISQISANLGDARARFALMANYYSVPGATDVADCLTMAEAKKALAAPSPSVLSDTCVTNLMTAVAKSLSAK